MKVPVMLIQLQVNKFLLFSGICFLLLLLNNGYPPRNILLPPKYEGFQIQLFNFLTFQLFNNNYNSSKKKGLKSTYAKASVVFFVNIFRIGQFLVN